MQLLVQLPLARLCVALFMGERMDAWIEVVTSPLGLVGFALIWFSHSLGLRRSQLGSLLEHMEWPSWRWWAGSS
jgi:hypothetical protein